MIFCEGLKVRTTRQHSSKHKVNGRTDIRIMSARLPPVARSGGISFYEQHQQQLQSHQQHSTTAAASSTMQQIHAAALQQRLHEYHQQRPSMPGAYDGCYYPSGSTSYMHRPHNSSPYSYAVPHYAGAANYLGHPHHHPHQLGQASTYPQHHADYGLLSHRTRFLPYAQQSTHLHHSMFTPAGQQLIPSSVLHYPPSSSIYPQLSSEEPLHPQQQPQLPHMYDFRSEPHSQYHLQQRHPYMPMHHVTSAGAYNPYAISQHHYQQSQSLLQSLPTSTRASVTDKEALTTSPGLAPLSHSNKMSNILFELPTASAETPKVREDVCKTELKEDEERATCATQRGCSNDSGPTTTSPPLISGTDSGISCCSTRGTYSDSTHSTPVYCDYQPPMSVDSSVSSVLHCTDGKEYEEMSDNNKLKGKSDAPSDDALAVKEKSTGITEHNSHPNINNEDAAKLNPQENTKNDTKEKELNKSFNTKNDEHKDHTIEPQSSTASTSSTSTISSPTNERCTTPFRHIQSPHNFQQQQQHQKQQQQQMSASKQHFRNLHISSSWSPFSISPNSWTQHYNSGNCTAAPDNRPTQQQSPPLVPVPPHNSPIDYAPRTTPSLSKPSVVGTSKNRIIECDLIPSKKSKRSCSTEKREVREEIRNITPLPGFQQTFGSTEIGRFSETFLHSPPVGGVVDQLDCMSSNAYAEPRMLQRAWSSYPFETFDFNGPRGRSSSSSDGGRGGGAAQFNLQQFGSRQPFRERPSDITTYERNAYGSRMNGSFKEIRCNGY